MRVGWWPVLFVLAVARPAGAWELSEERDLDEPIPTPNELVVSHAVAPLGDEWLVLSASRVGGLDASLLSDDGTVSNPAVEVPAIGARRWVCCVGLAAGADVTLGVWSEIDGDAAVGGLLPPRSIRAARFDRAGALLDPEGITVAEDVSNEDLTVAWNGTDFLVLWADSEEQQTDVLAARVGPDGAVRDDPPIEIATAISGVARKLACSAAVCLVVIEDDDGLWGVRIDASGAVLDDPSFAVSSGYWGSVAADGEGFLVAYKVDIGDLRDGPIRAALVSADGSVLDAPGPASPSLEGNVPAAFFDGVNYVVVFRHGAVGRAVRVDGAGEVVDAEPTTLPVLASEAGGCGGGRCLLVSGPRAFFLEGGVAGELFAFDLPANAQRRASAASDGEGFLVAWLDGRQSIDHAGARPLVLAAARLDASGAQLSAAATVVHEADVPLEAPVVAWDGEAFRVAWLEVALGQPSGALMLGGLNGDGAPIEPVEVADRATQPTFVCGPCGCLLLWQSVGLHGAIVREGVVGSPVNLGSNLGPAHVVPLGGGFLVARTIGFVAAAQLLDAEGTIIDAVELAGATDSPPSVRAAVSNGSSIEVLVQQVDADQCDWQGPCCETIVDLDVVHVRVDGTSLVVGDPVRLYTGVLAPASAAATFDGASFVVAYRARWPWSDWCGAPENPDGLHGVRVDSSGTVVEGPGALPGLTGDERDVSLASNAAGRTLLSYVRFDPEVPYEATRVRARVLEPIQGPGGVDAPTCAFGPSSDPDGGIDDGSIRDAGSSPDDGDGSGGAPHGGGCSCRIVAAHRRSSGLALLAFGLPALVLASRRWAR